MDKDKAWVRWNLTLPGVVNLSLCLLHFFTNPVFNSENGRQRWISETPTKVMILGVGSFAQSMARVLGENGATVHTYMTRDYGHWAPMQEGGAFDHKVVGHPNNLIWGLGIDFVLPQSIDWAQKPWTAEFLKAGTPIFCPKGDALLLERDRDFARKLCEKNGIPFPKSHFAPTREAARAILQEDRRAYVIKNPLCSPGSPIHTIVCETPEETEQWIERLDDAEGIFLQEYAGRAEAGHIALFSNGKLHSLVTNQEYKRAFDGNMGIVAGAPLGGLVEIDTGDKYGLAKELLEPLTPWMREVNYNGPVQVTACKHEGRWMVIEYNTRIGITSGPMILRMLEDPAGVLLAVSKNKTVEPRFKMDKPFGCSLTLAGFGYPYTQLTGPQVPVTVEHPFSCDVWWNEVAADKEGRLMATGHRIADVNALSGSLQGAIKLAYENIRKIRSLGSYYRTDVGQSLWPPGNV